MEQNTPYIEIIVVDDGSDDGSDKIAESYGLPVRLVRQKNQGPAAARNRGVKESSGELIAFLDGDDCWLPNKLNVQLAHLKQHSDVGIVYGKFSRWEPDNKGSYPSPTTFIQHNSDTSIDNELSGWIYHKLLLDNHIHIITAVIRRELFESLNGFDESLRTGEDYDFWLRASRKTQAHKLSQRLAIYRANPESTTNIARAENNELKVLKRHVKQFGLASPDGQTIEKQVYNNRLFQLYFDHGYMHLKHGSAPIAIKSFLSSIKYSGLKTLPKLLAYITLGCGLTIYQKVYRQRSLAKR